MGNIESFWSLIEKVKILKLLSLIVPSLTVENCLMSVICKMFDRNLVCFILTKILNFSPFLVDGWRQYAPNFGREIGSALSALPEEKWRVIQ